MARLTRQIGIRAAQVNLPERASIGPAVINLAQGVADSSFKKAADKRTQEAQLAASQLNFERDGDGNLVSPSLPIGNNGLIGPAIYDREYTNMVSQRYMQQTQIDTAERINKIATDYRFDPSGFRAAAEAYVAKVTELAPDMLKGDVNNAAQVKMVEHFNHIIREKAERDFDESRQVHINTIGKMYDDLHGYTVSGASDEIVGAQMMKIRASIEQGKKFNYWNDGEAQLQRDSMNQQYAVASIIGEVTKLASDISTHADAVAKLTMFSMGEGTVRMIDELGRVSQVPVTEVYPNTADRDAIATVGIGIIKNKEAARSGQEGARDSRQEDQFDEWYLSHAMKNGSLGLQPDMDQLRSWFDKADAADNEPLEKRILSIMQGVWSDGASAQGTAAERRAALALADVRIRQQDVTNRFLKKHGLESINELSPEQQTAFQAELWKSSGPVDIPQSMKMAEQLTPMYDSMVGFPVNFRDSKLEDIQNWIDNGPAHVGVITWQMSVPLNSMLKSGDSEQIDRALDIGKMMFENPAIKANMANDTALGKNGEALAYLFENYGSGNVQGEIVTDILKKFGTPGWTPHEAWAGKSQDEREQISSMVQDRLDGRFVSLFPSGQEVSKLSGIMRPDLGDYPVEMQEQIFNRVRSRAAFMNPDNPKTVDRHIDMAINDVVEKDGWVASKFGWTETRFTDKRPAVHAWSQFAPEAFYRNADGDVDVNVMAQLQADFQTHLDLMVRSPNYNGPKKLIAGENAFLEYNAEQTTINPNGLTHPRYNVRLMQVDDRGRVASSDRYTDGTHYVIDFELAYLEGNKKTLQQFKTRADNSARNRLLQQRNIINRGTAQ